MQIAVPCMVFRGGTSRGCFFLASDLPSAIDERDQLLLAVMGSPDERQIDGLGGAHPLTSKVAVISPSADSTADVDYLFLQVSVDTAIVSRTQNCGNMLAAVGPFAIEIGLVKAEPESTTIRINMLNTGAKAKVVVQTPERSVTYSGTVGIDGVPGTSAPVLLEFLEIEGSTCGALLPTGNVVDVIDGIDVTCIDNGMPVVLLRAADVDLIGSEPPDALEADANLKERIEHIRLKAGELMNLGDVSNKTVPKVSLLSAPLTGGTINTRTFIPHRVHEAVGVLGAVSVATACLLPGSIANETARLDDADGCNQLDIEHPTGFFTVEVEVSQRQGRLSVERASLLRTARLLMRGEVMVNAGRLRQTS